MKKEDGDSITLATKRVTITTIFTYMPSDNTHILLYTPYSTPGTNTSTTGSAHARTHAHTHARTHTHRHTHTASVLDLWICK